MQSFGKGEVSEELEKAAFNLGKDEISDVVESDGSYYILKCISTFDEAQTKANKEKIVKQRQSEAFDTEYTGRLSRHWYVSSTRNSGIPSR